MRILIYISCALFFISCKSQQPNSYVSKSEILAVNQFDFEQTVNHILKLYNEKNQEALSKLINKKVGLYYLYRPGTVDYWQNVKSICFNSKCMLELNISEWEKKSLQSQKVNLSYKLQKTNQEIVGCESVLKNGFFIEEGTKNQLFSETIKKYIIAFDSDLDSEKKKDLNAEIAEIKKVEAKSKRIVLAQNKSESSDGEAFVFYVTEIDGKWYLSIIDFISFDCSV
jgi:hypothetical protein